MQPSPIALSDVSMSQLMQACRPLSSIDRARLLELFAARLNGRHEVGDGEIYRLLRELQREVMRYPTKSEPAPQFFNSRKLRQR
jgi:hypothetical protein